MNPFDLIYPMFAMVLLTAVVLVSLFMSRVQAVREGKVSAHYFKTRQDGIEPESSLKRSRQFSNIFESPTLFYIACLAAMITQQAALSFVLMAWIFVLLRVMHAYIHIGRNRLRPRIAVYALSWIVLLSMWTYLAIGIALTAP